MCHITLFQKWFGRMSKFNSAFSYKQGKSFLHKTKPWIKILIIPIISVLFFFLPIYFSVALIFAQTVLCFVLHFTFKEQLRDFKVVFYYAIFLYTTYFIGDFLSKYIPQLSSDFDGEVLPFFQILKTSFINVIFDFNTASMLIKLFCVMQTSSIVFKTTTTLEIRQGVESIETAIRKILPVSKKNKFTNTISLFLCFIPMVFEIFSQSKRAWIARGGKNNLKMYMTILPILFSVGLKKAYNQARAIAIRCD